MKKNTHNPTRRNRNIGTKKSGHGQDNRMRIPESWHDDRVFWSKAISPKFLTLSIAEKKLSVIVEPVKSGFSHHVSPWDIEKILSNLGESHVADLAAIVLRQPKRKEILMSSVWGRFVWHADIGDAHGPMIMIEAQETNSSQRWRKSLKPEGVKELERLKADGHEIVTDRRHHHINSSGAAIRNTQLYRTLLHEIGHYEDYRINIVEKDTGDIDRWFDLVERYEQRTSDQKEQFAHQFAENAMETLSQSGSAPFSLQIDDKRLLDNDLKRSWFANGDV